MIIGSIDINLTKNQSLISNIKISGKNLIRVKNITGVGATTLDTKLYLLNGTVKFISDVTPVKAIQFTVPVVNYEVGSEFMLRFKVSEILGVMNNINLATGSSFEVIDLKVNGQNTSMLPIEAGYEVVATLKLLDNTTANPTIQLVTNEGSSDVANITVTDLKLEQGNKATDYSPAPEDIVTNLENQEQVIAGIKESTSPERIVETVIYSNEFDSVLGNKANAEDLQDYANNATLTDSLNTIKEYVDTKQALNDENINRLESSLTKTASDLTAKFGLAGGINLIQNSVGFFGTDFWTITGVMQTVTSIELERLLVGSALYSPSTAPLKATQIIPTNPGTYTLSFFMKKPKAGRAFITVGYADGVVLKEFAPLDEFSTTNEYLAFAYTFEMPSDSGYTMLGIDVDTSSECYITGLMLSKGDVNYSWTPHATENANTNIQMNLNGIKVINESGGYTIMSPSEFSGYADVLDEETNTVNVERIFSLNGENTEVNRLEAKRSIGMGSAMLTPVKTTNNTGWAIVKRGEE